MKRYVEKIIVPFIDAKRAALHLEKSHPALAIYDCFRGQTTPEFLSLLKKHNIISVQVPAHCTDKPQPLDVSVNKPIKDHLKKSFQSWYSEEVQKELRSVPVREVKVDVSSAVIKTKSVSWFTSAWESIQARPEIVINGFKNTVILDAVAAALKD